MARKLENDAVQPLAEGELITDRHIKTADEDRLNHGPIADEVAQLVTAVAMPCNIALYGPWGAGKSGLARLIEARLTAARTDAKFVIFDASKYAGVSLRRHFISQVASATETKGREFSEDLYQETTNTDVKLNWREAGKVAAIFLGLCFGAAALATALALLIALGAVGPTSKNFNDFIRPALGFVTAPAALALALMALAGKTLPVTRKVSAPSSEEEFEARFRRLRKRIGAERLVVFVDELDRCAPQAVVETLETIRTFLDVSGCVFLVAADQQVLERALREAAPQTNPVDLGNPYYSVGSEYLDKTFQHQLHVPPLRSQRLTQFALDLTEGRGGVWSRIERGEVVPVLVPTHVRSPRRVKALLNTYVNSYRIAARRLGGLDEEASLQLAKLICLQCEFPLFAANLAREPRLPEYVLSKTRGEELPEHVPEEIDALASDYAEAEASVDEVLLEDEEGADERTEVVRARTQQLVAYLQKTELVPNPLRALIHLELSGALTGIDETVADRLDEFAANGQREEVAELLEDLEETDVQLAALRFLAQATRDLPPGLEGRNGAKCLISAVSAVPSLDLGPARQEIAAAVGAHFAQYELGTEDLAGVFVLAVRTGLRGSEDLVAQVLERDELLTDERLRGVVSEHLPELLPDYADRAAAMSITGLMTEPEDDELVSRLIELSDEDLVSLLDAMRPQGAHFLALAEQEAAAEAAGEGGSAEIRGAKELVAAVASIAVQAFDGNRSLVGEAAVRVLLALDTSQARSEVPSLLRGRRRIESRELGSEIMDAAARRHAAEWPDWLDCLDPEPLADNNSQGKLANLGSRLWNAATEPERPPSVEQIEAALASLARLHSGALPDLQTTVESAVEAVAQDEGSANAAWVRLRTASLFATEELLDFKAVSKPAADMLRGMLETQFAAQPSSSAITRLVFDWLPAVAVAVDEETRASLRGALDASAWLPGDERDALRLHLAAVSHAAGDSVTTPVELERIVTLAHAEDSRFVKSISEWVTELAEPDELATVLLHAGEMSEIVAALRMRVSRAPDEAEGILSALIQGVPQNVPSRATLEALALDARLQQRAAEMLVERYEAAENNDDRECVLNAWRALAPNDDGARRVLIESVLLPLSQSSKGGHERVLRNLDLVESPPRGPITRLREGLTQRGKATGLEKQTRKAMEKHGLIEPRRKGLGLLRRR